MARNKHLVPDLLAPGLDLVFCGTAPSPASFKARAYYANPGKMSALNERFRKHTNKLFEKHGMTIIGFWTPLVGATEDKGPEKLVYILAFPSKEAAAKSWKAFQDDPDWKKAKAESEKDGKLVDKVESTYLNPTDYSPLK